MSADMPTGVVRMQDLVRRMRPLRLPDSHAVSCMRWIAFQGLGSE